MASAVCKPEILFISQVDELVASESAHGLPRVATVEAALEHLRKARTTPELIVLSQSRPGEFTSRAIDSLRRAAPLARYERVAGSWCEGEQRSGQPPIGSVNHYWHQWPVRFAHERARAIAGECPAWGLPPTMAGDERLLKSAAEPIARGSGMVVVCAARADNAHALAEVCRLAGYAPHVFREGSLWHAAGAQAVLWDTTGQRLARTELVAGIRDAADQAPIVAVVGFPRQDDCRAAHKAGVAAIISKPYSIRDLLAEVARVVKRG